MNRYLCCRKKLVDIKIPYEVYLEYHEHDKVSELSPSSEIDNFWEATQKYSGHTSSYRVSVQYVGSI